MIFFSVLIFMLVILVSFISSKSKKMIFSDNPFECGISSNSSTRKFYSLPFFFYLLIFLIFDIEIIVIFPFIMFNLTKNFVWMYMMILIFMTLTLFLEWLYGSLRWLNN